MTRYHLDDLDRKIIDVLGKDARVSNRKIAASLSVTEGTIRGRIKRLQEENYIRFTAITNPAHLGNPRLVLIGILAVQSSVSDLAFAESFPPDSLGRRSFQNGPSRSFQ